MWKNNKRLKGQEIRSGNWFPWFPYCMVAIGWLHLSTNGLSSCQSVLSIHPSLSLVFRSWNSNGTQLLLTQWFCTIHPFRFSDPMSIFVNSATDKHFSDTKTKGTVSCKESEKHLDMLSAIKAQKRVKVNSTCRWRSWNGDCLSRVVKDE